jgi:hypothetical protein
VTTEKWLEEFSVRKSWLWKVSLESLKEMVTGLGMIHVYVFTHIGKCMHARMGSVY